MIQSTPVTSTERTVAADSGSRPYRRAGSRERRRACPNAGVPAPPTRQHGDSDVDIHPPRAPPPAASRRRMLGRRLAPLAVAGRGRVRRRRASSAATGDDPRRTTARELRRRLGARRLRRDARAAHARGAQARRSPERFGRRLPRRRAHDARSPASTAGRRGGARATASWPCPSGCARAIFGTLSGRLALPVAGASRTGPASTGARTSSFPGCAPGEKLTRTTRMPPAGGDPGPRRHAARRRARRGLSKLGRARGRDRRPRRARRRPSAPPSWRAAACRPTRRSG